MSETVQCDTCDAEWPEDIGLKYCGECGNRLDSDTSIITEKERRTLTVLFADLAGFTSFAEGRDPEQVETTINSLFERLGTLVEEQGGYVDKFMGDAIMAVFGAPEAHEDDPLRAVRTGLHMIREIELFNQREGEDLSLRVGINRGTVIWSKVGGHDYTVTGDATNVAQRLEARANVNTVLVSHSVQKHTWKQIEYEMQNALRLKGREKRIQVYRAIKEKEYQGPYRETEGVTAPLLGRDAEMQQMVNRFEESCNSYIAITGEAGIGKSRFIREFRLQYLSEDVEMVYFGQGTCSEYGDIPLKPFGDILLRKIEGGRSHPNAGSRISRAVAKDLEEAGYDEKQRYNFAHLMAISIGLNVPEATVTEMEPARMQGETKRAWSTWFQEFLKDWPAVIVIDDLQWADDFTLELIDFLRQDLKTADNHVMMVVLQRPGGTIPEGFEEIELTPLDPNECRTMTEEIVGRPITRETTEYLMADSGGNPYFLEELLRYLIENEEFERRENRFHFSPNESGRQVPDTLNGLLTGRIDALPSSEKSVIKHASVVGRRFWLQLLERSVDRDIRDEITSLNRREMVFEGTNSILPGDREYVIKHMLLREAAYRLLTKKQRKKLHAFISDELEQIAKSRGNSSGEERDDSNDTSHPDVSSDKKNRDTTLIQGEEIQSTNRGILGLAARHAMQSDNPERAGALWIAAAEKAYEKNAMSEALNWSEKAKKTPEFVNAYYFTVQTYSTLGKFRQTLKEEKNLSQVLKERTVDTHNSLIQKRLEKIEITKARAKEHLGNPEDCLEILDRIIQKTDFPSNRIEALTEKAWYLKRRSRLDEGLDLALNSLDLARELGNPKKESNLLNIIGLLYKEKGENRKAIQYYRKALEIVRNNNNTLDPSKIQNNLGAILYTLGFYERALEQFTASLESEREIGDRQGVAMSLISIGIVHRAHGNYEESLDHYNRALNIFCEVGDQKNQALTRNNMSILQKNLGQLENALENSEEALDIYREVENPSGEAGCLNHLAEINYLMGNYKKAIHLLKNSEEISRETGTKIELLQSLLKQIEVWLHIQKIDHPGIEVKEKEIKEQLKETEALVEKTESHEYSARQKLIEIRYRVATGDIKGARRHLEELESLFDQHQHMDIQFNYLLVEAEVALAEGNDDEARKLGDQLVDLAEEKGEILWNAHGQFLRGETKRARDLAKDMGLQSLIDRIENNKS